MEEFREKENMEEFREKVKMLLYVNTCKKHVMNVF